MASHVVVGSSPAGRSSLFNLLARFSRSLTAAKSARGSSWGSRARKKPPRTARGEPWTVESVFQVWWGASGLATRFRAAFGASRNGAPPARQPKS